MQLTPRRALRAATATAAALALTLVAAAPSMAQSATESVIVDPSVTGAIVSEWGHADTAAVDPHLTDPAAAVELAQAIIDEANSADGDTIVGGATAFAASTLPAAASVVRAHFADDIAEGARLLRAPGTPDGALVAYADGVATVVFANPSSSEVGLEIDLRSFAAPDESTVTVRTRTTSAAGDLVGTDPAPVPASGLVEISAPAQSVLTAVASGLSVSAPVAALTPARAQAPASDLVGAPELFILESAYASGKVIELGNEKAQQTGPAGATYTAPAAVFPRSGTPAGISQQALTLYPVTGAARTYVIAARDGRVLARRHNDASDFRYLTLLETTIDAAAADPYAQWTAVDAGGGNVYLHNVQRDGSGQTAALDLYNWNTADASEVQTYTSGTAAVQQWRMRPLAPSIESPTRVIEPGAAPALPATLLATYSWGPRFDLTAISWELPDAAVWNAEGTVAVTGTATGYLGETLPVRVTYAVGALSDDAHATLSSHAGVTVKELRMHAPATVERTVSGSDLTVTADVRWDWARITDADLATAGTVEIPVIAGLGFDAALTVTLAPAASVNILRGSGVNYAYTFKDDTRFALTDGVRNVTGFADWRSGGATNRVNPNMVTFYLDEPQQITGASVFDIAGKQNIGGVTVQYRTLTGGWADLPGSTWPYTNATADLSLEVNGTAVLATGVRVVITPKSTATWMSLSEIEVRGLAAASAG